MSFKPVMLTSTRRNAPKINPKKLNPRCFAGIALFIPLPSGSVDRQPDPLQIGKIHPDEERLADDLVVRHEPPVAAVAAVVAIVAEHEVMSVGHLAAYHLIVIAAVLAPLELGYRLQTQRRHLGIHQHRMLASAQCLQALFSMHKIQAGLNVIVIAFRLLYLLDTIDP